MISNTHSDKDIPQFDIPKDLGSVALIQHDFKNTHYSSLSCQRIECFKRSGF